MEVKRNRSYEHAETLYSQALETGSRFIRLHRGERVSLKYIRNKLLEDARRKLEAMRGGDPSHIVSDAGPPAKLDGGGSDPSAIGAAKKEKQVSINTEGDHSTAAPDLSSNFPSPRMPMFEGEHSRGPATRGHTTATAMVLHKHKSDGHTHNYHDGKAATGVQTEETSVELTEGSPSPPVPGGGRDGVAGLLPPLLGNLLPHAKSFNGSLAPSEKPDRIKHDASRTTEVNPSSSTARPPPAPGVLKKNNPSSLSKTTLVSTTSRNSGTLFSFRHQLIDLFDPLAITMDECRHLIDSEANERYLTAEDLREIVPNIPPAQAKRLIRNALDDLLDESVLLQEPPPGCGFEALNETVEGIRSDVGRKLEDMERAVFGGIKMGASIGGKCSPTPLRGHQASYATNLVKTASDLSTMGGSLPSRNSGGKPISAGNCEEQNEQGARGGSKTSTTTAESGVCAGGPPRGGGSVSICADTGEVLGVEEGAPLAFEDRLSRIEESLALVLDRLGGPTGGRGSAGDRRGAGKIVDPEEVTLRESLTPSSFFFCSNNGAGARQM